MHPQGYQKIQDWYCLAVILRNRAPAGGMPVIWQPLWQYCLSKMYCSGARIRIENLWDKPKIILVSLGETTLNGEKT